MTLTYRFFAICFLVASLLGCKGSVDVQIVPNTSFSSALLGQGAAAENLQLNGDNSVSLPASPGEKDSNLTTITGLNMTGLQGYWKLDGTTNSLIANGSNIADLSGNNNDGSTTDSNSSMYYRIGQSYQGIEFDGSEDVITVPNSPSLNISGSNLTVMLWFKMDSGGSDDGIDVGLVCKGDASANEQFLLSSDGNNDFTFRVTTTGSGYNEIRPVGAFADGTWTHVAGTYDGSTMRIFVNGTQVASTAATGTIVPSALPLVIGKRCNNDNRYTDGLIDDVSVWDRTLTQSEIANIISSQSLAKGVLTSGIFNAKKAINWTQLSWVSDTPTLKPLLTSGGSDSGYQDGNVSMASVLHHFQLDEGDAASTFFDDSSMSNDASCSTCPSSNLTGRFNQAISFDGSTQYVEVPHSADFMVAEGTVALWFKPTNISGGTAYYLWSKDSSGFDTGGHLSISITSNLEPHVRLQSTTTSYSVTGASGVVSDKWQHMAVTFGAAGLKLYYNGQPMGTEPYTGGLDGPSSGGAAGNSEPIAIGGGTGTSGDGTVVPVTNHFKGLIDEAVFLGRQMSDADILNMYKRGGRAIKVQLKACQAPDCSDGTFVGPDGTTSTYFTEQSNSSSGLPSFNLSGILPKAQFFQYQATIESLDPTDSPKLKSLSVTGSN